MTSNQQPMPIVVTDVEVRIVGRVRPGKHVPTQRDFKAALAEMLRIRKTDLDNYSLEYRTIETETAIPGHQPGPEGSLVPTLQSLATQSAPPTPQELVDEYEGLDLYDPHKHGSQNMGLTCEVCRTEVIYDPDDHSYMHRYPHSQQYLRFGPHEVGLPTSASDPSAPDPGVEGS